MFKLALLCLIYLISNNASAMSTVNLSVSTFNVRWYGLYKNENRDPWIKKFMASPDSGDVIDSDVIAFQEIVNLDFIKRQMTDHDCVSYNNRDPKHQHVILCAKAPYHLEKDGGDDNYTIEEVAMQRLRPAVHAVLVNAEGRKTAHLIAVHLKAMTDHTSTRLAQIRMIRDYIADRLNDGLPVIMMGDFNTHLADDTGQDKNDDELFSEILSDVPLRHMKNPFQYTYRVKKWASRLDHMWTSPNSVKIKSVFVPQVCQAEGKRKSGFDNNEFYNKHVSDHCPLTANMQIQTN